MAHARVFRLVPVENQVTSFEEAFGEYSEVRGISKRRKKRKESRLELRKEKQEARQDRRTRRQEARSERSGLRQERRTNRAEAHHHRKQIRHGKDVAPESALEPGLDTATPQEMGGAGEMPEQPQAESTQTYGDETQSGGYADQGYAPEGAQGGQGSSSGQYGGQDGYNYGPEEGAPYTAEDNTPVESGGQGGYYGDENSAPYDESQDQSTDESTDQQGEGMYDENGDYVGEGSGYLSDYDASGDNFDGRGIDPSLQSTVDKLMWNAECVKRLETKRKSHPNQAQAISKKILDHKKRYNELKSHLDDYSNCYGDYSSADGLEPKRRQMMVKKAWGISQAKLKNAGKRPHHKSHGLADDVVPVASDLHPHFSHNRIVVPNQAKSYATGTGLNGLDLQEDFDAPNVREVFIGADGSKTGVSWGALIVGVGLGVAAVWAIRKYKLLK